MKSRIFRPEFLNDERLFECGDHALIVYLGLMSMADRAGRLEDRPIRIKAVVLPYHDVDLDSLLTNLHDQNFITRYEENGLNCIEIKDFELLQKPHPKESLSNLPESSVKCREITRKEIKLREKVSTSISKGKSKSISKSKEGECEGKPINTPVDKPPTPEKIARDELGHVLLSDDELSKLEKKYPELSEGLERLSNWIEAKKGQRAWFYKTYSGAFSYLNPKTCWVWREIEKQTKPPAPNRGFETKGEKHMRWLNESLQRGLKKETKVIDLSKPLHLNVDFVPLDEDDSPFFHGGVL